MFAILRNASELNNLLRTSERKTATNRQTDRQTDRERVKCSEQAGHINSDKGIVTISQNAHFPPFLLRAERIRKKETILCLQNFCVQTLDY